MPAKTFFVLQEFELVKKRWRPKQPREVPDRGVAERAVARLRSANLPCLAFARTGDPESGDWNDAELIAAFNVPPEFMGDHSDA